MIAGVYKLDKYLNDWLRKNKLDIKCKLAPDFSFDPTTNIITYALVIPENHSKLFSEVICKPLMNNKIYDPFILSLFHEIGHKYTINNFTKAELETYYKIAAEGSPEYYYNNIEYAATKWGCNYINNNLDKVKNLYEGFIELVKEFYMKNEVNNE